MHLNEQQVADLIKIVGWAKVRFDAEEQEKKVAERAAKTLREAGIISKKEQEEALSYSASISPIKNALESISALLRRYEKKRVSEVLGKIEISPDAVESKKIADGIKKFLNADMGAK